jgi:hypothetical protein
MRDQVGYDVGRAIAVCPGMLPLIEHHEEISKVGPLSPNVAAALRDLRQRERHAGGLDAPAPSEIRELLPSDDVVDEWFDVLPAPTVGTLTGRTDRQVRRSRRAARAAQPKRS